MVGLLDVRAVLTFPGSNHEFHANGLELMDGGLLGYNYKLPNAICLTSSLFLRNNIITDVVSRRVIM